MYVYDEKTNRWVRLSSTPEYRRRARVVRDGWLFTALAMLALPLGGQLVLALLATCLSFGFLDETVECYARDTDSPSRG